MSHSTKIILALSLVILVLLGILLYPTFANPFYSNLLSSSSELELKENYQKNSAKIDALKLYYQSITPDSLSVDIEYSAVNSLDLKVYGMLDKDGRANRTYFQEWNINPFQYDQSKPIRGHGYYEKQKPLTFSEVKTLLHWQDATFEKLAQHLAAANCIGIRNGIPTQISFRRDGLGMYSYDLFDKPISDSLKAAYESEDCSHRFYKPTVVLKYGGGAIGSSCFPDPKR